MTYSVLIDRNIMEHAVHERTRVIVQQSEVLGRTYQFFEWVRIPRRPRPENENRLQEAIDALPSVAAAIQDDRIRAFTSPELDVEAFRTVKVPPKEHERSIFDGCRIETVSSAFNRSKFGMPPEEYYDKKRFQEFCSHLITWPDEKIAAFYMGSVRDPHRGLTDFERKCLQNLHIYRGMCRRINHPPHHVDALHLWTAEMNGMDFFLSNEWAFRRELEKLKVDLHCRIVDARELAALLLMLTPEDP